MIDATINAETVENLLKEMIEAAQGAALYEETKMHVPDEAPLIRNVLSYEDAGVCTTNKGLVLRLGQKGFQITIVEA